MPQTIMLAVHCKRADPVDLKGPMVDYVRQAYGQQVGAA